MLKGGFGKHLSLMAYQPLAPRYYPKFGIETYWQASPDINLTAARVKASDDYSRLLYRLCTCAVKHQLARFLPFIFGLPKRFWLLLDLDSVDAVMVEIRVGYEIFKEIQTIEEEWAKTRVRRSPFQLLTVLQIVIPLEQAVWLLIVYYVY